MAKGIGCHMLTIEDLLRNGVRDKKSLTCSLLNVFLVDMCCFALRGKVGPVGRGEGNGLIQNDSLNTFIS